MRTLFFRKRYRTCETIKEILATRSTKNKAITIAVIQAALANILISGKAYETGARGDMVRKCCIP